MATTYSGDFLAVLTLCLIRGGRSSEVQSVGTISPPSESVYISPDGPSTPVRTSTSSNATRSMSRELDGTPGHAQMLKQSVLPQSRGIHDLSLNRKNEGIFDPFRSQLFSFRERRPKLRTEEFDFNTLFSVHNLPESDEVPSFSY